MSMCASHGIEGLSRRSPLLWSSPPSTVTNTIKYTSPQLASYQPEFGFYSLHILSLQDVRQQPQSSVVGPGATLLLSREILVGLDCTLGPLLQEIGD